MSAAESMGVTTLRRSRAAFIKHTPNKLGICAKVESSDHPDVELEQRCVERDGAEWKIGAEHLIAHANQLFVVVVVVFAQLVDVVV